MNLLEAPFRQSLRVTAITRLPEEVRLVLVQLGIDQDECIEKVHSAPLGDPIGIRIGQHLFSLRQEVCREIDVELFR